MILGLSQLGPMPHLILFETVRQTCTKLHVKHTIAALL